jgi:23S rRNA (guanosine2251-2'-O)-methyltransferase
MTVALVGEARAAGIRVERVTRAEVRRLAADAHSAVLALDSIQTARSVTLVDALASADNDAVVLVLDHLTDPQNLGAILRSADQFGVSFVVMPTRRSAPISAAVIQASAGTAQHVVIVQVANIARSVEQIKESGFWVYGAEMGGEAVHQIGFSGRVALILGSEGSGLSRLARDRCDKLVRIPRTGRADSLNVSVACGVLLYEVRRAQGWLDSR